jgi:hypothetical protein
MIGMTIGIVLVACFAARAAWQLFARYHPPILDADVPPFDIAKFTESLVERRDQGVGRRTGPQKADTSSALCLLRSPG